MNGIVSLVINCSVGIAILAGALYFLLGSWLAWRRIRAIFDGETSFVATKAEISKRLPFLLRPLVGLCLFDMTEDKTLRVVRITDQAPCYTLASHISPPHTDLAGN